MEKIRHLRFFAILFTFAAIFAHCDSKPQVLPKWLKELPGKFGRLLPHMSSPSDLQTSESHNPYSHGSYEVPEIEDYPPQSESTVTDQKPAPQSYSSLSVVSPWREDYSGLRQLTVPAKDAPFSTYGTASLHSQVAAINSNTFSGFETSASNYAVPIGSLETAAQYEAPPHSSYESFSDNKIPNPSSGLSSNGFGSSSSVGFSSDLNSGPPVISFGTLESHCTDVCPNIEIGKAPPPRYSVKENFQQSFRVVLMSSSDLPGRLKREPDWATAPQESYGVPANYLPVNIKKNSEGSILTQNRIYSSPKLFAARTRPLQIGRPAPPTRIPHRGFSNPQDIIELLGNISRVAQESRKSNFAAGNGKSNPRTVVATHMQSFSVQPPPTMDSDLLEAQRRLGFGANNFVFGNSDTIVAAFKELLSTDFDEVSANNNGYGVGGYADSVTNSLDTVAQSLDRIVSFCNATQKIHNWAHERGEKDALRAFSSENIRSNDAIPFIDTAPVTETLSAAIF